MQLELRGHFPKRQDNILPRIKFISKSLVAMLRYFYIHFGIIRTFIELISTVIYFDILLLMTRTSLRRLLYYHPALLNGSLYRPYMATQFNDSRRTRYIILTTHYKYLSSRLKKTFYDQSDNNSLILWSTAIEDDSLHICICFEKIHRSEGDLTLSFEMNSATLYQLSFTIVPGALVGCSTPRVLMIGRVQGASDRTQEIRRATKLCREIAPPYLLVTAAQAIALELGISLLAGVSSGEQLSKTQVGGFPFQFDYDSFWKNCCGTDTHSQFYVFSASFVGKPLDQIGSAHRRRTRLKRQFKSTISESVRSAFAEKCIDTPNRESRGPGAPADWS